MAADPKTAVNGSRKYNPAQPWRVEDSLDLYLVNAWGKGYFSINEAGLFRFLQKPCGSTALKVAVQAGAEQYRTVLAEKELLERTLSGSIKMLTELMVAAEGPTSDNLLANRYANFRKTSIYAGSNEIQRNIIAMMSLGL